ncbi:MAG: hypothetical protein CM1200mP6_00220 [Anaerolineaceae bacterium]|nr:MAG: hypothetical protein CM1200mP6_00220 [Anaerolineaceae bacterium]
MIRQRREFMQWSILAIIILCFSGVYALLTIIPRYIFPIMPLYLIMAAYVVVDLGYRSRKFLGPCPITNLLLQLPQLRSLVCESNCTYYQGYGNCWSRAAFNYYVARA